LINPLVQDLHPRDSGRYLNVTNAFFSMGVLITVLSVGELLTLGLPWRAIMGGLGFVFLGISLFFTLASRHAHKTGQIPADSYENPVHHARKLLKQKRFWVFALAMVCGGDQRQLIPSGVPVIYRFTMPPCHEPVLWGPLYSPRA
jgi:fucose permease